MAPMVDRELFLRQGYLILDIIPQQQLPAVRDAFEDLAWRQREQEGGWATTAQPRFTLDLLGAFDAPTAAALELAVGGAVRDVSAQLLQCAEPLLANCQMFVEPQHEPPPPPEPGAMSAEGSAGTDPRNWHRDLRPDHNGPLRLLQEANAVDGPAYVQWNICLHDQGDAHLDRAQLAQPPDDCRREESPRPFAHRALAWVDLRRAGPGHRRRLHDSASPWRALYPDAATPNAALRLRANAAHL